MKNVDKLSLEIVLNFVQEYVRFKDTKYQHLRFGQAFLNYFYPDLSCPELFYQESNKKAEEFIMENFVKEVE
jgi:hypothetical protein